MSDAVARSVQRSAVPDAVEDSGKAYAEAFKRALRPAVERMVAFYELEDEIDEADAWYAAELERMRERSPA